MSDPREPKLPKWAQDQLSSLRRKLSEAEAANAELRGIIPVTNTFVANYTRKDTPLPNNARITFMPNGDEGNVRQSVMAYIEQNGRIRIQGDYALIVRPGASNSLTVELENYR